MKDSEQAASNAAESIKINEKGDLNIISRLQLLFVVSGGAVTAAGTKTRRAAIGAFVATMAVFVRAGRAVAATRAVAR